MQATFEVTFPNGDNVIVQNLTPFVLNPEWENAMAGILSEDEMQDQLDEMIMTEFLRAFPAIQAQWGGEQGDPEMHDPQAGQCRIHPKLTKQQYKALPSRRFKKADLDKNFKQINCSICQEAFKSNQKIPTLPCGHDFHWNCLKKWVTETRQTCPLCQSVVL